ncbi:EAL domain-containing protein [Clostridium botulinum]|uniref:EAL domain-containing protein n=1 Tax=Clostridium botulinum TaxID=1491 RepID=UPI0004D8BCF8|nr:EAL domain-containing protein [Clostridium botulinum]KEI07850.1 histidine kinase [Clostridium botulinum C/D str. BKT2873]
MQNNINIKQIIEDKNLQLTFEPVVSIIKQSIIGFKVSSVGCYKNEEFISIDKLMKVAEKDNLSIELDRLYREKAVEIFAGIYSKNKELFLFININASLISKFVGSGIIMELIDVYNINPENIVLEIVEDKVDDIEGLRNFINFYRSKGFLVSLSDIGYGLANLDKISYVEPDIIKISGVITENISSDYYKQEIFKALVNLSKNIGALVIGDGIKSNIESLTAMELGADMLGGSHFGNCEIINDEFIVNAQDNIVKIAKEYENYMMEKAKLEKHRYKNYEKVIKKVIQELSITDEEELDDKLSKIIDSYDDFECIYLLNEKGVQITDTFTYYKNMMPQKALIFSPAKKGTKHSLKKYYYFLKNMALRKYVTEPYISLATGNLCITISSVFEGINNKKYILCIDFNPNDISL